MRLLEVPLTAIDTSDTRFRITVGGPSRELGNSISLNGILSPPLLWAETPETLLVVSGFRRLHCIADQTSAAVTALVLAAAESDPRQCLLRSYHENAYARLLATCEKAALAARLRRVAQFTDGEIVDQFLPALQLPANQTTLDQLLRLDRWPDPVKELATESELSQVVLLALADLPPEQAAAAVGFLAEFRWGHSRQREICTYLQELGKLRRQGLSELIAEARRGAEIDHADTPTPQRAERIRQWLRRHRFPRLLEAQDTYQAARLALRLPPQVVLQEPADFEGHAFRVQFQFRSREEYEQAVAQLQRISQEPAFDTLLGLL